MDVEKHYKKHWDTRSSFSDKIVNSNSDKKIVMAGPGAGKSHLFKDVAKKYIGQGKTNILVLSFINELVKDLTVAMHGLAKVSTLHSFAAKELKSKKQISMELLKVISDDYTHEKDSKVDFAELLHTQKLVDNDDISYLRARREYYSASDPASIVHQLVAYYSDPENIPEFDLILVDEYQDFNLLEIALINLLSSKSHVLVAGDDDQSLYSFKHAAPDHIRELHTGGIYEPFELPYCSRSTEVIIDSFHDVVKAARGEGLLGKRTKKDYLYFPNKDKDEESKRHSQITVTRNMFQGQVAYYIDKEIKSLFENIEPEFDVLIICSLKSQIKSLATALKKCGYTNVRCRESVDEEYEQLSNGLTYILENKESNLGWRLCTEVLLDNSTELKKTIDQTTGCDVAFSDCVSKEIKSEIKSLRATCVKILENSKTINDDQRQQLYSRLGINAGKLGDEKVKTMLNSSTPRAIQGAISIKITTILGSKGLSHDYVFMVNFDDKYLLPKPKITDESVNKFLVALTRSRKKAYIYTSQKHEPKFISWIDSSRKASHELVQRNYSKF